MPLFSESAEGDCDEVQGLSSLSLQEELDQVQVKRLLPAVELQQSVDACFQKQSIIDGIQTYAWLLISADMTPLGEG